MSVLNFGISAITKLAAVAVLAAAFLAGLVGVVYWSLQGKVVQVPEIVGKNFADSEKELAALGLKIKRRAERPSGEQPNTVLEQLPKPGETVKTGQLIFVVTSQPTTQPDQTPSTLKKSLEEDDTEKIEEMISEKPKKRPSNSNANSKKPDTTRDVIANSASTNSNSSGTAAAEGKKSDGETKNEPGKETTRPSASPAPKSSPAKPTAGAERPRTTTRP
ncbi:MAG: PASTA domain-containing protein [Pyrinomonadaceae bacterium]